MFAKLYESMADQGFNPREVDEMEGWEAAAVLGVHRGVGAEDVPVVAERDFVAERLAAAAAGATPPKPDVPKAIDPGVVAYLDRRRRREA